MKKKFEEIEVKEKDVIKKELLFVEKEVVVIVKE